MDHGPIGKYFAPMGGAQSESTFLGKFMGRSSQHGKQTPGGPYNFAKMILPKTSEGGGTGGTRGFAFTS